MQTIQPPLNTLPAAQPPEQKENEPWFLNFYECPCGNAWEDEWDCMCDDRCSECNTSCEPSRSTPLHEENQ